MTHPFHPLAGRSYDLVNYTYCWGEPRVYFYDEAARLRSLPALWTSIAALDPFAVVAAGRCAFRFADLVDLARLVQETRLGV